MKDLIYLTMGELLEQEIPAPKPLLGSWLTSQHICMIYAQSGVGKSLFAMSIALAVAGGGECFGWKAHSANKVLIVDGEMDMHDLQERVKMLSNSIIGLDMEKAKENLSLLPFQGQHEEADWPDLANKDHHDVILQRIEEEEIDLVIFDNLSTLANVRDENNASEWRGVLELFRKIKRLGCSTIMIHHSRKGSHFSGDSYRGSQVLSVLLSTMIMLEGSEDGSSVGGASFKVIFQKSRAMRTEETKDRSVTLNEAGQWEFKILSAGKANEVVQAIRSREYCTQAAVAEGLGWSKSEVSKQLKNAYELGLFSIEEKQRCFEEAKDSDEDLDNDPDF